MSASRLVLAGCRYRRRWASDLRTWDLDLGPGELVHLSAPNGTGKSTFLRAALGLEPARWARREFADGGPQSMTSVRYVPSDLAPSPLLPVQAYLDLLGACRQVSRVDLDEAVTTWGLESVLTHHGDQLSTGQQRAVVLAAALVGQPAVVLLDEPFAGLDRARRGVLVSAVERIVGQGGCVLAIDHDGWMRGHLPGREITDE